MLNRVPEKMAKLHNHETEKAQGKKLLFVFFLNIGITLAEAIGGFVSLSLALLSDALHNLSDVFAIVISYVGFKLAQVENSEKRTFGLKRAEVFAALINAALLAVLSIFLFLEAYHRLKKPLPVNADLTILIGFFGLLGNLASMGLLYEKEEKSLNIYSAFLHMFADALSSIAVILGALLMKFYGLFLIDPLLTFGIGAYVLYSSFHLLSESVRILMQVAPKNLDVYEIKREIEKINGISDVHHIHLWSLTDKEIFFEAHVESSADISLSEACEKISTIEKVLKQKFGISHVTIQMEYKACKDKSVIKKRKLSG